MSFFDANARFHKLDVAFSTNPVMILHTYAKLPEAQTGRTPRILQNA